MTTLFLLVKETTFKDCSALLTFNSKIWDFQVEGTVWSIQELSSECVSLHALAKFGSEMFSNSPVLKSWSPT
jgi:hypothetical protein